MLHFVDWCRQGNMVYIVNIGDYKINIRTELGSGTFGKVYRGRHSSNRLDVAAKKIVLDGTQASKDYVLTEVHILLRVKHHPYILQIMYHQFLDYANEFNSDVHELWLIIYIFQSFKTVCKLQ